MQTKQTAKQQTTLSTHMRLLQLTIAD